MALLCLTLVIPAQGNATGPAFPEEQAANQSAAAAVPPSIENRTAAVRERLARIRARLSTLPPEEAGAPLPPGATAEEWAEHRRILRLLDRLYEDHLDSLSKLKDTLESQQELKEKAATWQGFQEPPPSPRQNVMRSWRCWPGSSKRWRRRSSGRSRRSRRHKSGCSRRGNDCAR